MSAYDKDAPCPECGHAWAAHQGRRFEIRKCCYRAYRDYVCFCNTVNPRLEEEDRHAAGMWNAFMGRF